MEHTLGRVLIETAVRKTIKDIRQDPKRSIRNLVDLALNFSEGRFQQRFFEAARDLLYNEESAYYDLVQDTVERFDTDRLVAFGMNVGYNGCTQGAARIRSIEATEHFNIPWCISLNIDPKCFLASFEAYENLIEEGRELGIYTWQLHMKSLPEEILKLPARFPDCAFLIFCPPQALTPPFIQQAGNILNVMFAVSCDPEGAGSSCGESGLSSYRAACEQLQKKGIPYGIHLSYDRDNMSRLTGKEFLEKLMELKPVLTFFAPLAPLSAPDWEECYSQIKQLRSLQEYPTVFMELLQDNHQIDSIISSQSCSAGFTGEGQLYSLDGSTKTAPANFYHTPLKEILKTAFPKNPE